MPPEINEARRMTKIEFIRICNEYLYLTRSDIEARLVNPATTAIELIVAAIVLKSFTEGDQTRLNFLLDRMIGKVTEKIQHTGANDGPITINESLSDSELDRRAAKIFQRLKDKFKNGP